MKKKTAGFKYLAYRTPTWFKEKVRKKIIKIKSVNKTKRSLSNKQPY